MEADFAVGATRREASGKEKEMLGRKKEQPQGGKGALEGREESSGQFTLLKGDLRQPGKERESERGSEKMAETSQGSGEVVTILGSDTQFKGSLTFERTMRIEGKFEGELNTKGTLFVGKEAEVKATIQVGTLIVEGKIEGNIIAQDKVTIRSTAEVIGDTKAGKLQVEEGATLVGRCEVSPKAKTTPEAAPPRKAEAYLLKDERVPLSASPSGKP